MDEHLVALARALDDGAGEVDPGHERGDPRHLALRDRRQRVLVVDARAGHADDDVALAELGGARSCPGPRSTPSSPLVATNARISPGSSAIVVGDEAGAQRQQRQLPPPLRRAAPRAAPARASDDRARWSRPRRGYPPSRAISSSDAGARPSPSPSSGRHRPRRMRCCCSEKRGVALSSPGTSVGPIPIPPGLAKITCVRPTRTSSPSESRRRPISRSSLTQVPFWESPSSEIVHSPARSSSSACRREHSGSHGSEMSASSRRPIVTDRRPRSSW